MLDNPIWHALATEQAHFAERIGAAGRFPPAVTALAGLEHAGGLADLARLVQPGEMVGTLLDEALAAPGLAHVDTAAVLQMIHDGPAPQSHDAFDVLGAHDVAAMVALADATRPGPFGTRTGELGVFLGVKLDGRLVAMAGQRMRLPGSIEISGVCTDPAHLGRGHAARLVTAQLALIRGAGAGAFLHVRADNARAIALYERLGFHGRRTFAYSVFRRAP